jgi:hypothetical protein
MRAWNFVIGLVRFVQRQRWRNMNALDLKRIDAAADRLNAEAEDVLKYQDL